MDNHDKVHNDNRKMVITTIIVGLVVIAVIIFFVLLRRWQDNTISAANSTGQLEITNSAGTTVDSEEVNGLEAADTETVYLIEGNEEGSNRYERVDKLSYTDSIRYTEEDLSQLDSYGLLITRNEIYARHGRMFNDQTLQEYFELQDWYVAQTAPSAFDESCLNEVELYNIELIASYELELGS